jgi:hypothetical protein
MPFNIRLLLLKITGRIWSPSLAVHCCNCYRKLAITAQRPNNAGAVSIIIPHILAILIIREKFQCRLNAVNTFFRLLREMVLLLGQLFVSVIGRLR